MLFPWNFGQIPCLPGSCASIALQLAASFFFFTSSLVAFQQVTEEESLLAAKLCLCSVAFPV